MAVAPSTNNLASAGAAVAAAAECTICLGEFEEGDAVRAMPLCRHNFHASCIDRWLAGRGRRSTCPTCRAPAAAAVANAAGAGAGAAARSGGDGDCAQHVAFAILAGLQLISLVLALVEATVRYFKANK